MLSRNHAGFHPHGIVGTKWQILRKYSSLTECESPELTSSRQPEVLDKATSWKGHPQPPVNKRLQQAKIFLADEDINRCLNFVETFSEIEEWLQYVEKEKLECDPQLFQDVKTMAIVQRDWLSRMDAPLEATSCSDRLDVPNISSRLVDADSAKRLAEARDFMGLVTEMREDHAPFTVDRSEDQAEFLQELKKDSETRSEEIDEHENLLYVEDAAYSWALDQPSLIPYWMHWEKGLPNKGLKPTDPGYQFRRPDISGLRILNRPQPDVLPDFLKSKETAINNILAKRFWTQKDYDDIELLIYSLEPDELHREHSSWNEFKARYDILRRLGLLTDEDDDNRRKAARKFREKFYLEWLNTFRDDPIQLMIAKNGVSHETGDGVLYVSIEGPPQHLYQTLKISEIRINNLLQERNPSPREEAELNRLLLPYLDDEIRHLALLIDEETERLEQREHRLQTLKDDHAQKLERFMHRLRTVAKAGAGITLHIQGPGDSVNDSNEALSCPWPSQYFPSVQFDPSQIPPELVDLQTDINHALLTYRLSSAGALDANPDQHKFAKEQLDFLLPNIMPPKLRRLALQKSSSNQPQKYSDVYQKWLESLLNLNIRILIPPSDDFEEGPNIFYWRGHVPEFGVPDHSVDSGLPDGDIRLTPAARQKKAFAQWARRIRDVMRRQDHTNSSNWVPSDLEAHERRGDVYDILADLQPPSLRYLDRNWRNTSASTEQGAADLISQTRGLWRSAFLHWARNIQDEEITIRLPEANENIRYCPDDPGHVYYRGPLKFLPEASRQSSRATISEDTNSLPDAIKRDQDLVQDILLKRLLSPSAQLSTVDQGLLERILRTYWGPARIFYNELDQQVEPIVKEARAKEYRQRSQIFIDQCLDGGFRIIQLPKRQEGSSEENIFVAVDTTTNCPEKWREKIAHRNTLPEDLSQDFEAHLKKQWSENPTEFYNTILDMESELNRRLNQYHEIRTRSDDYQFDRLMQLLRPFLPPRILQLRTDEEMTQARSHFLEDLAEISKTAWIKIRCMDPKMDLDKRRNESGVSRNIYFTLPKQTHEEVGRQGRRSQDSNADSLLVAFKQTEKELNDLVKKHQSKGRAGLSFDDMDRLRRLMRTIMPPDVAEEDDDLRGLDDNWRTGTVIQADYFDRTLSLYQWISDTIEEVGGAGISFVKTRPESPPPGIRYLELDSPAELPRDFRSSEKPVALVDLQHDINKYISLERPRGLTDEYMERSLETHWEVKKRRMANDIIRDARRRHNYGNDDVMPENLLERINERIVLANCRVNAEKKVFTRLASRGQRHVVYSEPQRGLVLTTLERGPPPTSSVQDFSAPVSTILAPSSGEGADIVTPDPVSIIIDSANPSLADVRNQFFSLANKVKTNTLTDSERAEAAHFLAPIPPEEQEHAEQELMDAMGKLRGHTFPHDVAERAIQSFLIIMWQNFGARHPELRAQIVPTPMPVHSLLEKDLSRGAGTETNWDNEELKQIASNINGMIASFQSGQLSSEESSILDYLLRPLTRGPLAELYDRIAGLNEERLRIISQGQMVPENDPPFAFVQYVQQYNDRFDKWKKTLVPGEIFVDELYYGSEDINRVVERHRM